MAFEILRPFTAQEHKLFLKALEKHGESSTGKEWDLITNSIGTRRPREVALHAHQYFLLLQAMTSKDSAASPVTEDVGPSTWTLQEDTIFEAGLAYFSEADEHRWLKLSELLPGKDVEAVRERFKRLIADISNIESGRSVAVRYLESSSSSHSRGEAGAG